jgi:hypothetical protein
MEQSKSFLVKKYSNPTQVKKLAKEKLGENVKVFYSSRENKKYMLEDPNGKWIHFGQLPYEDFTKHKDTERRENFLKRNAKWKDQPKWTAGWLSYHLLW